MQNNITNLTQAEFNELMQNSKADTSSQLTLLKELITDYLTDNKYNFSKEDLLKIINA